MRGLLLRYGDYDAKDAKGQPLVALPPSDGTTYRVWFACKIGDNFSAFDGHAGNMTKTKLILDSLSPAFQLNDLGPITDGQVDVQMTVKNHSTRPETVRIGFQVESATGTVYSSYQSSEIPNGLVELRPGELRKLRIKQDNLKLTPDNNALWFDVRSLGTPEKTLCRTRLTKFQRTHNNAETARLDQVTADLQRLNRVLQEHFVMRGTYPDAKTWTNSIRLPDFTFRDPWGEPYVYSNTTANSYTLFSTGAKREQERRAEVEQTPR